MVIKPINELLRKIISKETVESKIFLLVFFLLIGLAQTIFLVNTRITVKDDNGIQIYLLSYLSATNATIISSPQSTLSGSEGDTYLVPLKLVGLNKTINLTIVTTSTDSNSFYLIGFGYFTSNPEIYENFINTYNITITRTVNNVTYYLYPVFDSLKLCYGNCSLNLTVTVNGTFYIYPFLHVYNINSDSEITFRVIING